MFGQSHVIRETEEYTSGGNVHRREREIATHVSFDTVIDTTLISNAPLLAIFQQPFVRTLSFISTISLSRFYLAALIYFKLICINISGLLYDYDINL